MRRCESRDSATEGRLLLSRAPLHRMLEVKAGAEIFARALQHHHARGAVALQALEIAVQRIDQGGIERVQAFRAIERYPVDAVFMFDQERLRHNP